MRHKNYNKRKCTRAVKEQFEGVCGIRVALLKHFAFEWSVVIEDTNSFITIKYPREKAKSYYRELKKIYIKK